MILKLLPVLTLRRIRLPGGGEAVRISGVERHWRLQQYKTLLKLLFTTSIQLNNLYVTTFSHIKIKGRHECLRPRNILTFYNS